MDELNDYLRDQHLKAQTLVAQYYNRNVEHDDSRMLTTDDVHLVWFCYTLGNWKALLSTTVPDGMYYELTQSFKKGETFIDVYKKVDNVTVRD